MAPSPDSTRNPMRGPALDGGARRGRRESDASVETARDGPPRTAREPSDRPLAPSGGWIDERGRVGTGIGARRKTSRRLGPTRLPRGSRSNRSRMSPGSRALAGLRAYEHSGGAGFLLPTASRSPKGQCATWVSPLDYRCGAAPGFEPGSLLSRRREPQAPTRRGRCVGKETCVKPYEHG